MTTRNRSTGAAVVRNLALWVVVAVGIALVVVIAGWRPRVEYVLALAVVGAVATVALRRLGAADLEPGHPRRLLDHPAPGEGLGGDQLGDVEEASPVQSARGLPPVTEHIVLRVEPARQLLATRALEMTRELRAKPVITQGVGERTERRIEIALECCCQIGHRVGEQRRVRVGDKRKRVALDVDDDARWTPGGSRGERGAQAGDRTQVEVAGERQDEDVGRTAGGQTVIVLRRAK